MPLPVRTFAALWMGLLLLSAGCQPRKGGDALSEGAVSDMALSVAPEAKMARFEGPAQNVAGNGAPGTAPATVERMLIRTGELTLEVDSAERRAEEARRYVGGLGGYVSDSRTDNDPGSNELRVTLTLRLPADAYDASVSRFRSQARYVRSQSTGTQDVTEEFVDVEARLKTRQALEVRYLELLRQAARVEDIANIEDKLAQVRGDIESMQGRLKYLRNQVALSTLTLSFVQLKPTAASPGPGFGQQLSEAFAESFRLLKGFVLTVVQIAPSLVIALALVLGVVWVVRRWRGRR